MKSGVAEAPAVPRPQRAWMHVVLVFAFMLINFADKSVIGLSSVPIMRELSLNNTQFGMLGSAFFLLFSISGVAVGFLANRIRTKTLMFVMAMVWALALLPMGLVSSFALLLASRVVLGAAEGPAFPVALHAVYKWFPDRRRALPTSVVACGAAFGTGVVAPLITWIIVHHGWHAAFTALGLSGMGWGIVWLTLAGEGPVDQERASAPHEPPHVPYLSLLTSRTALGVYLAGFGAYWVIALNITWLANYLIRALHVPAADAAWIIGLPAVLQMVLAPGLAWVSEALGRSGVSSRVARGILGAGCVIVSGMSMMVMTGLALGPLKIALIGLSFSIGSVIFTLGSALIGEIAPLSQRGAMLGITNSIHTVAGLCAPLIMGRIVDVGVDPLAGFRTGYLYAGAMIAVLGACAAVLIEPQADLRRFRRQMRAPRSALPAQAAS